MNFRAIIKWGCVELDIGAHVNTNRIVDAIIIRANGHLLTIDESNFLFKISNNEIDDLIMEAYFDEH
jgi:hypothetical protein